MLNIKLLKTFINILFLSTTVLLLNSCGDKVKAEELYKAGKKEYDKNNLDAARDSFIKASELDKDFLNAYLMTAKTYYFQNKFTDALQYIEMMLSKNKDHDTALYWKAKLLLLLDDKDNREKNIEIAEQALKKTLEINSSFINARLLLAQILENKKMYKEAIYEYSLLLQSEKELIQARVNLGNLYKNIGMEDYAKDEFKRVLVISDLIGYNGTDIKKIKNNTEKTEKKKK